MNRTIRFRMVALIAAVILPMFAAPYAHSIPDYTFNVNFSISSNQIFPFAGGPAQFWAGVVDVADFDLANGETIGLNMNFDKRLMVTELGDIGNIPIIGTVNEGVTGRVMDSALQVVPTGLTWTWEFTGVDGELLANNLAGGTDVPGAFVGNLTNTSFTFDDLHVVWTYTGPTIKVGQLVPLIAADQINPVPEPTAILLLGTGLIGLARLGRKKIFMN